MPQPRRSRAIATVVGGVLLAIALLALLALYFYLNTQQQELLNTVSQAVQERISTQLLAPSLQGYYTYNYFTSTLTITITSNAPRAVAITSINILWDNQTILAIDRYTELGTTITAIITSASGATTTVTSFPVTMAPGDTLEVTINQATWPITITATLSASPAVAVITIQRAQINRSVSANVTLPQYGSILLPTTLSGYVVAEKGIGITLSGPFTAFVSSADVIIGSVVGGSYEDTYYHDGQSLVIASQSAPICGNYQDWEYTKKIIIINPNAYSYDDVQARIELNSSNFDFNHAKSDGSDIRIVTEDCTPLDYWIEEWDPVNQHAVIWVKIPHIDPNAQITLHLFYGNSAASYDNQHYGLTRVMTPLPANDGPGYTIYYQEWIMPTSGLIGGGTPQGWHRDDGAWSYTLPFDFPYYNEQLANVYVCSNGFISVTRMRDYWVSTGTFERNVMIAPFWEDLMTNGDSHDIFIRENYRDKYGQAVVIRWYADFYYHNGVANFELVLYKNGLIRFNYGDIQGYSDTNEGNHIVGISLGDNNHYTITSYTSLSNDELSNVNSLMLWPRKKPSQELIAEVGPERHNSINKVVVLFHYGDLGFVKLSNVTIYASLSPATTYNYELVVKMGGSVLYSEKSTTSSTIDRVISISSYGSGQLDIMLQVESFNAFQLAVDQLVASYFTATFTSSKVFIASNLSSTLLVLDTATNSTSEVDLRSAGFTSTGYTVIASEYASGTPKVWVLRGSRAARYDLLNHNWDKVIQIDEAVGPGAFAYSNGTHLFYCPGDGASTVYIYNISSDSLVTSITLPMSIGSWSNVAPKGSILYIHTSTTGHLLALNTNTLEVTDLGETPSLYPIGMDYYALQNMLILMVRGGGLEQYNVAANNWSALYYPLPYYPLSPGDRLVILGNKLYYIRADETAEVLVIDLSSLLGP